MTEAGQQALLSGFPAPVFSAVMVAVAEPMALDGMEISPLILFPMPYAAIAWLP